MDKTLIKMVILTEKLNELCINDILNNKSPNMSIVDKIKSSEIFSNDLMDIFLANYYVKNVRSLDKSVIGVVNFIEDYSKNKYVLYNCFLNNIGFANEIIISYLKNYGSNKYMDEFYDECSTFQKSVALNLSPIWNYQRFDFLPTLVRATLFKIGCENLKEMKRYSMESPQYLFDDINIVKSFWISDAYTYMNLNREDFGFDKYIDIIESNASDMNSLFCILQNDSNCLATLLYYISNQFIENDYYSDLYKKASQNNPQFLDTLKKINPFYILDEIEDFNQKKYRKI